MADGHNSASENTKVLHMQYSWRADYMTYRRNQAASPLILLDWEKTFDKTLQPKMLDVLRRLQVPHRIYRLIKDFHANPQFKVRSGEKESEWRFQSPGIRQGCPLSPYLFVRVMGALFADIKS